MAFRPDEQVVRGEIDNRTRGRVTGRIWFLHRPEPVELSLDGNAWSDLAGRRLEFVNPKPVAGDAVMLAQQQVGVIGDCTASRKVKVLDVPREEFKALYKSRKPMPWHWGNSLYLEWYSRANGRVVIESAAYRLTITDGPAWHMSAAEEAEQRVANAAALTDFLARLAEAEPEFLAPPDDPTDDRPAEDNAPAAETTHGNDDERSAATSPTVGDSDLDDWAPERPMTEEEAERFQAESEKLVDRIQARLDREGPNADYEKILEEELDRRAREQNEEPLTLDEEAERSAWLDEVNAAADELTGGDEWEFEADEKHPLAERSFELTIRLHRDIDESGWLPEGSPLEHPVSDLLSRTSQASAKIAGALNGQSWPPDVTFCANDLVRLKRARGYLDDALAAAADCRDQALVDGKWLGEIITELEAIGATCDALIAELRAMLERGSE